MGITRMTALTIYNQGDNIVCAAGGPSKSNGKYAGWINLNRDGEFHRYLLNTDARYDTGEEAEAAMQALVAEIRAMDEKQLLG